MVIAAVTFYASPFVGGVATGLFLAISAAMTQITGILPIAFAFLPEFRSQDTCMRFARYAFASGVNFTACCVQTVVMISRASGDSGAHHILNAATLIIVLVCCLALARRAFLDSAAHSRTQELPGQDCTQVFLATVDSEQPQNGEDSLCVATAEPAPGTSSDDGDSPGHATAETPSFRYHGDAKLRPFRRVIEELSEEGGLTPQEGNVLLQLARGLNARSISESMMLSSNTVRTHMRNVYAKLDVHSQQELIELVDRRAESVRESARLTHSG